MSGDQQEFATDHQDHSSNNSHEQINSDQSELIRNNPDQSGLIEINRDNPDWWRDVDTSAEALTIPETVALFKQKGVPREDNAIRKYCKKESLTCFPIESPNTRDKIMVRRESALKRIEDLRLIDLRHKEALKQKQEKSGLIQPEPDQSGLIQPLENKNNERDKDIEKLTRERDEAENKAKDAEARALKAEETADEHRINDIANKRIIKEFKDDRYRMIDIIKTQEQEKTLLQVELKKYEALEAPKSDREEHAPEPEPTTKLSDENQGTMFEDNQSSNDVSETQAGV